MLLRFRLPYRSLAVIGCSLFSFMSAPLQAHASSPDAWLEFQQEVEDACRLAASSFVPRAVFVDPYGSESFGYAVMIGLDNGATTEGLVVCAYDLSSQTAEISGVFDL